MVSLAVDLPPDQFLAELRKNTVFVALLPFFVRQDLIGRVGDDGRMVLRRNSRWLRNSWQSLLEATVVPYNSGSLIEGHFRLNRFVAAFSVLWISLATLGALATIVGEVSGGRPAATIVTLIFPGFFIAVMTAARFSALSQEPRVLEKLRSIGSAPPR